MNQQEIKSFSLEGIISDKTLVTTRERLILSVESDMRDEGYVPLLDLEPQFTLDFQPNKENYVFRLTVYGIYIGMDEAWTVGGMMNGKKIMNHTLTSKSSPS